MSNFLKIMLAAGSFLSWAEKAGADGVIDADEVTELVKTVLNVLGIKAEIKLGSDAKNAVEGLQTIVK